MSAINLSTGIRPGTQIPLDDKLYFKLLADMLDLGLDDYKAFSYYDGMQATCIEDDKIYMWREASGQLFDPALLPEHFVYPSGSIVNGIDYSGKSYNFFEYYKKPSEQVQFDKILNGNVRWIGGLNFRSTPINFRFNGIVRTVPVTNKTLTAAHATLNRIDVFAVDTANELVVIEGTPAADPLEPAVTFSSQLRVNAAYIPATSSIPQGASEDLIYDENVGSVAEWDATAEKFGATEPGPITSVLFDSVNNPDTNNVSIEGVLVPANVLLNFSRSVVIPYAGISSLFFRFNSQIRKGYFINIKLYSTTALLSSIVVRPGEHGFDPFTLDYTDVNIPFSEFTNSGNLPTSIKKMTVSFNYQSTSPSEPPVLPSFFMDNIKFVLGGENPLPKNSFFDLAEVLEKDPKSLYGKYLKIDNNGKIVGFETNFAAGVINLDIVVDQTADDLDTLYPDAENGFEVFCPNVASAPKTYIRATDGQKWIQFTGVALIPSV